LIDSHRRLGITVGVVFIAWCVSDLVLMYYGVPHLTASAGPGVRAFDEDTVMRVARQARS
jgi:hypothetical protein